MSAPVMVVVGTRPEAIKLAPVVREIRRRHVLDVVLVSTGQHREMLDQALGVFGLRPDVDLGVMSPGQTLYDVTCRTLDRIKDTLVEHRPAWVVVQGDTTTAFAAALAASYEKLRVAHVEAGLRSGERHLPFPEELNRRMVDQLADALFAPTELARRRLLREGFPPEAVFQTGNTVVDALLWGREIVRRHPPPIPWLAEPARRRRPMILVTAHRRESFGPALEGMCGAMLRVLHDVPDAFIVYPVHPNPNVEAPVDRILGHHPRIVRLAPVSYLEFIALMERAHLVLTDSGGVQEEAPTFHKPLLVMREVTERPEGVEAGVARLVGTSPDRIHEETVALLTDPVRYAAMTSGANPYGDGKASRRIAAVLEGSAAKAPRAGRSHRPPAVRPLAPVGHAA